VLVMYRDPLTEEDGLFTSGNVVQFEEGLKIDFSLWAGGKSCGASLLRRSCPTSSTRVTACCWDKDQLTARLRPPSYQAYIPKPPTETEYGESIERFLPRRHLRGQYLWRGRCDGGQIPYGKRYEARTPAAHARMAPGVGAGLVGKNQACTGGG